MSDLFDETGKGTRRSFIAGLGIGVSTIAFSPYAYAQKTDTKAVNDEPIEDEPEEPDLPTPSETAAPPPTRSEHRLKADRSQHRLRPPPEIASPVWSFNGQIPGPVIRAKLNETLAITLDNGLDVPLSLHWHGVRNANAMDGVGGLTQDAVQPGQSFTYSITPPDTGAYLIRPCIIGETSQPSANGLQGVLIVEEAVPPPVDHELVLVVDDWLLTDNGAQQPFGDVNAAIKGRLGNLLTIAGNSVPNDFSYPAGARIRLRLLNACNARVMHLRFDDFKAYVIAVDARPTDSFEPLRSILPFGPGSRYDILFDMPEDGKSRPTIVALLNTGLPLATFKISEKQKPARTEPLPKISPLPENTRLPQQIRLQDAARYELALTGQFKRNPVSLEYDVTGDVKSLWRFNGVPGAKGMRPVATVKRGSPVVFTVKNETPLIQPMHLHGHVFRLLHPLDDGWEPYWLDTLMIPENKTVQMAFVADNPGKWLLASTVAERFDAGLWTWFLVE